MVSTPRQAFAAAIVGAQFLTLGFLLAISAQALAAVPAAPSQKPLFREFMGLNGHTVQFRPELYRATTALVRDYHPVEWDLGTNTATPPPFPKARNGVDWNSVYGSWKKAGIGIDASLMFETLSKEQWGDLATNAWAYGRLFARSFGRTAGAGMVDSVEIGNEPGKFTDADYRAMFEHMARGIKSGDNGVKVVTCALTTGKSHDYAKSVACIEGLEPLCDAFNVHTYAMLENWPTWKRSFPEDPRLKDYIPDVQKLCDWRDAHAPGKEVWITEFGYDASTRKPEPKGDFKDWVGVSDVQQAQWIVRSWLLFATLPVQRAYLYFFNDEDTPQLHGASGITRHFQPKPAFHATAHLLATLGDYRFGRTVLEKPGEAIVREFEHGTDTKSRVWVAWSPTGSGRTARLVLPRFEGKLEKAERMPLSAELGATKVTVPRPENIGTGTEVSIDESPLYLFLRSP